MALEVTSTPAVTAAAAKVESEPQKRRTYDNAWWRIVLRRIGIRRIGIGQWRRRRCLNDRRGTAIDGATGETAGNQKQPYKNDCG